MTSVTNLKVVLLGESFVGKTAIASRFVTDSFDANGAYQGTVGASFLSKTITVDNITCDLAIWDTAGQEVYRTLTPMYYRDAQIALIVFDITAENTFKEVESWYKQVKDQSPNVVITICGNKSDLTDRKVEFNQAYELAHKYNVSYLETSAKTGAGVFELFETAIADYFKKNPQGSQTFSIEDGPKTVDITSKDTTDNPSKGCPC